MINLHHHVLYRSFQALALVVGALVANVALATPSPTTPPDCTTSSVTITSIETSPLDGNGVIYTGTTNATNCKGLFEGNDWGGGTNIPLADGGNIDPIKNIGQAYDGLLNGGGNTGLSTTWFNSPSAPSKMLAIDGDGNYNDPGWIRLGKIDNENDGQKFSYDSITTLGGITYKIGPIDKNPSDGLAQGVVTLTMQCGKDGCASGTWSLETSTDIVTTVQSLLGRNAFDHLALVLKAGTWYGIYDFDFNILSKDLTNFNYVTPYSIIGGWDMGDFDDKDISHISLWARDPSPDNEIPEPTSLALLGIGLLGLGLARRRRS